MAGTIPWRCCAIADGATSPVPKVVGTTNDKGGTTDEDVVGFAAKVIADAQNVPFAGAKQFKIARALLDAGLLVDCP